MLETYLKVPENPVLEGIDDKLLLSVFPSDASHEGLEMLDKVILACGLEEEKHSNKLAISAPQALASTLKGQKPHFVVVYGLSPKHIGAQWESKLYTWMPGGGRNWCFAERLETINADMDKKRLLWSCLKRIKEERDMLT